MPKALFAAFFIILFARAGFAFEFENIDGGIHDLDRLKGQPVLVVNTASRCAFTKQYDDLQALYDRYRDRGLVVLAVPSNDFRQELASAKEVKEFCALNFDLDLPMTTISSVIGADAHPFYAWVRQQTGFQPRWNFNKVLLDHEGQVAATFGSSTSPTGRKMTREVERLLRP